MLTMIVFPGAKVKILFVWPALYFVRMNCRLLSFSQLFKLTGLRYSIFPLRPLFFTILCTRPYSATCAPLIHFIIIGTIHYRTERWPSSSTIISQLLRIKWTLIAGIHFWIRTLNAGIFRFKITTLFAGICQRKRTLNAGTRGFLGSKLWPFSRVFLFAHCIKGLIRSSTPGATGL